MGRQGGSVIPTRKSPGSTKSEIAAAQEHTIRKKALAAVEALMGMGPMQERLTHAGIALSALSPDEFPEGTRPYRIHYGASGSQSGRLAEYY